MIYLSGTRHGTRHKMRLQRVREKVLWTYGQTDVSTDTPSYRDAAAHLKTIKSNDKTNDVIEKTSYASDASMLVTKRSMRV